jgi:hypothetical protein
MQVNQSQSTRKAIDNTRLGVSGEPVTKRRSNPSQPPGPASSLAPKENWR